MPPFKDYSNKKFNNLNIKERVFKENDKRTYYRCICDCGKEIIVRNDQFIKGTTKSCGCYQKKEFLKRITKHKKSNDKLYGVFVGIKQRCLNKNSLNYKDYGGRGIVVCKEWLDKENGFINFYNWAIENGYKEGLTIDRINNDGNYEPSNCRFTTYLMQSKNKRNSVIVEFENKKYSLSELSELYKINYRTLLYRLKSKNYKNIEEIIEVECKKTGRGRSILFKEKYMTTKEISELTGRSCAYINKYLKLGKNIDKMTF